jgi:hypothetical protein
MAKTRKARSSGGLFTLFWSPFKHLFMASGESAHKLGSTAGKIVKESMKGVEGVGSSFARHTNQAIGGITKKVGNVGKGMTRRLKRK